MTTLVEASDPDRIQNAEDLVNERFDQIDNWLESYDVRESLDALKDVFTDVNPSTVFSGVASSIDYDFIESAGLSVDLPNAPDAPTTAETTFTVPDKPERIADFRAITFTDLAEFSESLSEIADPSVEFLESVYASDLLSAIKTELAAILSAGGTGLGSDVEDAIWDRAQARQDIQNEKIYNEAENYFAARGFSLPPGALAGRIAQAQAEIERNNVQLNAEISIEQARLAQTNTHYNQDMIQKIEALDQQRHHYVQQRAYELARDSAAVIQKTYELKVNKFLAAIEEYKTRASVNKIQADATAAYNKNIADVLQAETAAYKSQIEAELGMIETVGQIYAAKVAGFGEEVKAKTTMLNAQIEEYKAKIQQSTNQTQLSIQEAQLVLSHYIQGTDLAMKQKTEHSALLAQIVASLYNAVSVSANMSESYGKTKSLNDSQDDAICHKSWSYSESAD